LDLLADYLKERVTFGLMSTKATIYDSTTFKSRLFLVPGQGITWMASFSEFFSRFFTFLGSHLNLSIGTFFKFFSLDGNFSGSAILQIDK
uniref:RNA-dependent RNA polymerase n=1 Tax=Gongylonema pulchrum TaxID=637853 RepID=A0A183D3E9_9BILA